MMNSNKTLDIKSLQYKSNDFNPIIIRKENSFCVYLPELRVSGVGPSLDEAYQNFEQNFKSVEDHAAEFGLANLTPEPYPIIKRSAILQDLVIFYLKLFSSSFIVIIVVILLLPNITSAIRHNIKEIFPKELISSELKDPRYWAYQLPAQMNERLDRITPEEEQKMRKEWNRFLGRTVPVISPLICHK